MDCPHCKGNLKEALKHAAWKYVCKRCGRAWIILDDVYWLAGFDAGGHIYKIQNDEVEQIRQSNPLWQKLWDRVEG